MQFECFEAQRTQLWRRGAAVLLWRAWRRVQFPGRRASAAVDDIFTGVDANQRADHRAGQTSPIPATRSRSRPRRSTAATPARSAAARCAPVSTAPPATSAAADRSRCRDQPSRPGRAAARSTTATGTVQAATAGHAPAEGDPEGWSRAGGTAGHRQGRRDRLQSVAPLRRARRRHHEGQRADRSRRPEGRPEDRHPDLCLFAQGAGLGARQQSRRRRRRNPRAARISRPTSCRRPAAEARGAAAAAEAARKATPRRTATATADSSNAQGRQPRAGTYTVQEGDTLSQHRQEDRRQRHRAQGGERPRRRPDPRSARR